MPHDLVAAARQRWLHSELAVEREVIQATLISAYLNDGWDSAVDPLPVTDRPVGELDLRRRRLAAGIVERLLASAVEGQDGTAAWLAPAFDLTGWSVRPLAPDSYSGLAGIAVLLAGYQHEVAVDRADPVPAAGELLSRVLHSMRLAAEVGARDRAAEFETRPELPGLYVGLGSEVWTWLRLRELGAVGDEGLDRALAMAELLPWSLAGSTEFDVLVGDAGSIIALLALAEVTGDAAWLELARSVGASLTQRASREDGTARWRSARSPDGIGGFAHGATGIGWALARLASADPAGGAAFQLTADEAFAFEETLYQPAAGGWRDARDDKNLLATAWCHGATGIGLASADLLRRRFPGRTDHADVVRRAAAAVWNRGMGWNHTICHGDLGGWELLDVALELGLAPDDVSRQQVDAYIVSSIERHGPVNGVAREAFAPGLLPGQGGIAYQLLRMHPECDLGSVLILD